MMASKSSPLRPMILRFTFASAPRSGSRVGCPKLSILSPLFHSIYRFKKRVVFVSHATPALAAIAVQRFLHLTERVVVDDLLVFAVEQLSFELPRAPPRNIQGAERGSELKAARRFWWPV